MQFKFIWVNCAYILVNRFAVTSELASSFRKNPCTEVYVKLFLMNFFYF